ncbi:hypothetical protein Bca4012_097232 [Brassica carinata]
MHNVLHTIKAISYSAITSVYSHHHHHHHHHHRKPSDTKKKVDICDDFPKNIPPPDTDTTSYLCVDKKGCCNFTTVQSAVDAIGNFSQKRNVIWINSGMYYEKVVIPKTKPNITLQGQGFDTTAIAWNDTAYSANGTFYCATVQVFGSQFVAKNISFMNVAPIPKPGDVGAQAVAIRIGGDQSAFLGCGFFGAQDTLHDDRGRHYFKNCYIQGSIDFIFGNAKSLYQEGPSKEALGAEPDEEQSQVNAASDQEVVQIENSEVSLILPENPKGVYAEQILGSTNEIEKLQSQKSAELRVLSTPANTPTHSKDCQIISMANQVSPGSKSVNGAVTANGRNSKDENSGFAFVNCTIGGTGHVWLGRAWRPYSRVIFVSTYMTDVIAPEGWNNFNDPSRDATIFYGEYNCSGPGADVSKRAPYVQKLNDTQVAQFINMTFIDGDQWLQLSDL